MSIRISILALAMLPIAAHAEDGRVIGDSIGVGVTWASKLPSTAKNSVAIYSGAIMEQLRQAKKGETVFLSLGTNDAVGGALDVKAHVTQILDEADRLGVKLVWIGPPCVLKPWEKYAKQLDGILASELQGRAVYVSTQTPEFCSTTLHAAEGVHFTMAGYVRMWQKAAAAAGFSTAVASAEPTAAEAAGPSRRSSRHERHHGRRHHHRHVHATETPEQTEAAPQ